MMQSCPSFQLTGVATLNLAVSCKESTTRSSSSKFRPQEAGYVIISLIFLSGPITNTDRTVMLSAALGWILSYSMAVFFSGSAIMGKFTVQCCVSLMSLVHPLCDSSGSTLIAITLTPRFSNSPLTRAIYPSSVVQTGVKSLGCENRMPQPLPSHSWKVILPSVVSAVKFGASSPNRSAIDDLLSEESIKGCWQPPHYLGHKCTVVNRIVAFHRTLLSVLLQSGDNAARGLSRPSQSGRSDAPSPAGEHLQATPRGRSARRCHEN